MHLLLTKADKLKRGASSNTLLSVRKELQPFPNVTVQLFSALQPLGVDEVRNQLTEWLSDDDDVVKGEENASDRNDQDASTTA